MNFINNKQHKYLIDKSKFYNIEGIIERDIRSYEERINNSVPNDIPEKAHNLTNERNELTRVRKGDPDLIQKQEIDNVLGRFRKTTYAITTAVTNPNLRISVLVITETSTTRTFTGSAGANWKGDELESCSQEMFNSSLPDRTQDIVSRLPPGNYTFNATSGEWQSFNNE